MLLAALGSEPARGSREAGKAACGQLGAKLASATRRDVPHLSPDRSTVLREPQPHTVQRRRVGSVRRADVSFYRGRVRAEIVLAAARGRSNARIARQVRLTVDTVRTWRGRFADQGIPGWPTVNGPGGRRGSRRWLSPRSRPWPASYPPRAQHHCRAGHVRNWPAKRSAGASPTRCPRPPCAGGWTRIRSNPGSTANPRRTYERDH